MFHETKSLGTRYTKLYNILFTSCSIYVFFSLGFDFAKLLSDGDGKFRKSAIKNV